jgi:hypothetical protein
MYPPPLFVPVVSASVVVVVVVDSSESDSTALERAAAPGASRSGAVALFEQPATTASAATRVRGLRSIGVSPAVSGELMTFQLQTKPAVHIAPQ